MRLVFGISKEGGMQKLAGSCLIGECKVLALGQRDAGIIHGVADPERRSGRVIFVDLLVYLTLERDRLGSNARLRGGEFEDQVIFVLGFDLLGHRNADLQQQGSAASGLHLLLLAVNHVRVRSAQGFLERRSPASHLAIPQDGSHGEWESGEEANHGHGRIVDEGDDAGNQEWRSDNAEGNCDESDHADLPHGWRTDHLFRGHIAPLLSSEFND